MDTYKKSQANLFVYFTIKKIVNYASRTGAIGRFVIQKTHSSSRSLTGEYGHLHTTLNRTLLTPYALCPCSTDGVGNSLGAAFGLMSITRFYHHAHQRLCAASANQHATVVA